MNDLTSTIKEWAGVIALVIILGGNGWEAWLGGFEALLPDPSRIADIESKAGDLEIAHGQLDESQKAMTHRMDTLFAAYASGNAQNPTQTALQVQLAEGLAKIDSHLDRHYTLLKRAADHEE